MSLPSSHVRQLRSSTEPIVAIRPTTSNFTIRSIDSSPVSCSPSPSPSQSQSPSPTAQASSPALSATASAMEQFASALSSVEDHPITLRCEDALRRFAPFAVIYERTHVRPIYAAVIAAAIIVAVATSFITVSSFIGLVAIIYPAYRSYHTLEQTADVSALTESVVYWIYYGAFRTTDAILARIILTERSANMYAAMKCALLLYCLVRPLYASAHIYDYTIRPLFRTFEKDIDFASETVIEWTHNGATDIQQYAGENFGVMISALTALLTRVIRWKPPKDRRIDLE